MEFNKKSDGVAEGLTQKHTLSREELEEATRDYLLAVNSYNEILNNIKTSRYYSPFDGTVTKIVRYDGSGLNDNDTEIEVTKGLIKLDAKNKVAMVCNRWPGTLDVKVKLGQKVKKGQLLFSIDNKDFELQKDRDMISLDYIKRLYERRKKLNKTKSVSLYILALTKNEYDEALMKVEIDKIKLKQTRSYAPFNGTVTKVYRYSGSGNGAGKPVVDITSIN